MRVGALILLLTLAGCGDSYEERDFQLARRDRSVLDLANYLDAHDSHREQARALIDKHYEYALSQLGPKEPLRQALLTHLRSAQHPRITVVLYPPSVAAKVDSSVRAHFQPGSGHLGSVVKGANRASGSIFDKELVVFESDDIPVKPGRERDEAVLQVRWEIAPSDFVFEPGTLTLGRVDQAPIRGIEVHAVFAFHIPGQEPLRFEARAAPGEFSYSSFSYVSTSSDVYAGMVETAFQNLLLQVL